MVCRLYQIVLEPASEDKILPKQLGWRQLTEMPTIRACGCMLDLRCHGAIPSEWATTQELSDFALPYGVTQGLSWPAAIFREADLN